MFSEKPLVCLLQRSPVFVPCSGRHASGLQLPAEFHRLTKALQKGYTWRAIGNVSFDLIAQVSG